MTLHLLVEGRSEEALLDRWLPRISGERAFRVHPHKGKGVLPDDPDVAPDPQRRGLLDQLPAKLRGYAASGRPSDHQVIVLVDADKDDPEKLAERIVAAAKRVAPSLSVAVCLAVEETEAFYLGDLKALALAFPSADMVRAREYVPDSICGTWELFGEIVGDAGGNKVAWAEAMGSVLTTQTRESRSPSFRLFLDDVRRLSETPPPAVSRVRRHRHVARASKPRA